MDEIENLEYNLDSEVGRTMFLADLTGTPMSSVIGNKDRLLNELNDWVVYG